jgi:hypothetical protein
LRKVFLAITLETEREVLEGKKDLFASATISYSFSSGDLKNIPILFLGG